MTTLRWPASRTKRNGNCPECRLGPGRLEFRGETPIDQIVFYRLTCNYCGFTQFFERDVIRATAYRGSETEELPG